MDDKGTVVLCDATDCKYANDAEFIVKSSVFYCTKDTVNIMTGVNMPSRCISYDNGEDEDAGGEQ